MRASNFIIAGVKAQNLLPFELSQKKARFRLGEIFSAPGLLRFFLHFNQLGFLFFYARLKLNWKIEDNTGVEDISMPV